MDYATRIQLEEDLATEVVEGMDMDALVQLAIDHLSDFYKQCSDNELLAEVEEYAPHLLPNPGKPV